MSCTEVLYGNSDQKARSRKEKELFPNLQELTNFECSIAAAYFFDKGAINNLNYLIEEIQKTRKVWIVEDLK